MVVTVHAPVNYSAPILTHVSMALAASHIDFRQNRPLDRQVIVRPWIGLRLATNGRLSSYLRQD
jgi:hypothetical protein